MTQLLLLFQPPTRPSFQQHHRFANLSYQSSFDLMNCETGDSCMAMLMLIDHECIFNEMIIYLLSAGPAVPGYLIGGE